MQYVIEEEGEAHIPFNSLLLSIRNPMKCDMEEEAFILVESLARSIKSSTQHDIEEKEEAHIPFNALLISIRNPMKCDM